MEITTDPFVLFLRDFNELIKDQPPIKDVKNKLCEIKASVLNAHSMTGRQVEALVERCDNYLNGSYGRNLSRTS